MKKPADLTREDYIAILKQKDDSAYRARLDAMVGSLVEPETVNLTGADLERCATALEQTANAILAAIDRAVEARHDQ